MLRANGIHAGYGAGDVLAEVDLTVHPGQIVALVGANGAGKTTLLKVLTGLLRQRRGTVLADDVDLGTAGCAQRVRRARIVLVPEGRQVFGGLTVAENLELGAWTGGIGRASQRSQWDLVFDLFPALAERRDQPAGLLSGGQQQMVALGRGLMAGPKYLLLDEPSLGLAPIVVEQIFDRIGRLAESGIGVLVVDQNATVALGAASYGYVLGAGRVVDSGPELLDKPELVERYFGVRGVVRGQASAELIEVLRQVLR